MEYWSNGEKHFFSFLNYIHRANYQSEVLVIMPFKPLGFQYFQYSNTPLLHYSETLLSAQLIVYDLVQRAWLSNILTKLNLGRRLPPAGK